jgi:hypothetical protein
MEHLTAIALTMTYAWITYHKSLKHPEIVLPQVQVDTGVT